MVIEGMKSGKGGKVEIHATRKDTTVSTNLWGTVNKDYGWFIVTDPVVAGKLQSVVVFASSKDPKTECEKILADHPDPTKIGVRKNEGTFVPKKAGSRGSRRTYKTTTATPTATPEPPKMETETPTPTPTEPKPETPTATPDPMERIKAIEIGKKLINFFSEFNYKPSRRFANTLSLQGSVSRAIKFTTDYFDLQDHPDKDGIREKVKSTEYKELLKDLLNLPHRSPKINNRLIIYFGDPGTGKTTQARTGYPTASVTICNESMTDDDLLTYIKVDGDHTAEHPSTLMEDIINGRVHILDEINLLPYKTLRFLQGLTDGKPSFEYKGENILVGEGFKIVGTMNLYANGQVCFLPDPLVDRAESIEEFIITPEAIADSI